MKSRILVPKSRCSMSLSAIQKTLPIWKTLSRYHNYDVSGLENIPKRGKAMIVVNHSLATYDIVLLQAAIYHHLKRVPRPLVDRLFFKIPYIGALAETFGAVEGKPNNAKRLLQAGELLTIAPGGMQEAIRDSGQKYKICWEHRKGFARIALETRTPVVIAVCPKADELYKVYSNNLTDFAYKTLKIPFCFARGVGLTPIPRPVPLTHYLSEAIRPPKPSDDPIRREKQVARFHRRLIKVAENLIQASVSI